MAAVTACVSQNVLKYLHTWNDTRKLIWDETKQVVLKQPDQLATLVQLTDCFGKNAEYLDSRLYHFLPPFSLFSFQSVTNGRLSCSFSLSCV